ncbi:NUDIX hydrolase [Candidatus Halocynthiibacter alkanivorans]|uniref:NUDIX hydrolase n=1 Tax=Candidatus Halocynthiibacter alkanivorans TaxID=2267619 RepID=UPI000DF1304D|nr:NUDIX hydrolase [Candidatus Halocynthiibacter alkanivorans]
MTDRPKLASLAVVLRESRLILVRRKNEPDAGLWGFPGGHVDIGETALAAASRELREETSVFAEAREYLHNLDLIVRADDGTILFHYLLAAVLCDYVSGEPCAADDVSDARWIDADDVLNGTLPLSEDVDTVLKLALARQASQIEVPTEDGL